MNEIESTSLLGAWADLFQQAMEAPNGVLGPTTVRLTSTSEASLAEDDGELRLALDRFLRDQGFPVTWETAKTIFPYRRWRTTGWNIAQLTEWYVDQFMPRMRALPQAQRRHTYFERMVAYSDAATGSQGNNQLEFLIDQSKRERERAGRHFRQNGLQIALFDPLRDHQRTPYRNFPCLQQVGLFFNADGRLGLHAFYPTQTIIERALGNYLGLSQLGTFLAAELDEQFGELVCSIGSPRLGDHTKTSLRPLESLAAQNHPCPADNA